MTIRSAIAPPFPSSPYPPGGRYAQRSPLSPIHAFTRGPARNRDRQVVDPRCSVGFSMNQCVRQEMLVVALGKVGSLMRAAGFFSMQRGFDDRLCNIEHPRQLEQRRQLRIEGVAVIVDAGLCESFLQHPDLVDRLGERWSVA